jgi:hypothetical protein
LDVSSSQFDAKKDDLAMAIIEGAKDYDLSSYDFVHLRQKAFDEKLRLRLEAANRAHQENKENQASCITSSDDDEDEEQTTIKTLVSHMENLHIK